MKPLVTTTRALKELATGLSPEAIGAASSLFQFEDAEHEVILSAADEPDSQRIVIVRASNATDRVVPDHLSEHRSDVIGRMAGFGERAQASGPLSLPRGWHQFKRNNLIAFFAVPSGDPDASRWIAEVSNLGAHDVIFWEVTTSDAKGSLEDFEARKPDVPAIDQSWAQAHLLSTEYFEQRDSAPLSDVDIALSPVESSATKGWSYEQWIDEISPDQRAFVDASTDHSIRLRGPAGSGKTLTLTLKAVHEALSARESGHDVRILIATHSWSLAAEIADSLDTMTPNRLDEIEVFPLLEIAQEISPQYVQDSSGFSLVGNDSLSGKQAQLDEIFDLLVEFIDGDWISYRSSVTPAFQARFDSDDIDVRIAFAWDLLIEFGSVIGAAAIFPGAGSELRYKQLPRSSWMLPLSEQGDFRVVFELYCRYMERLESRSLLTSDQVLADLLSHLETHAWNRARKSQGYDLIFVDEFHLFSPLERQVLHYLTRDASVYPRVFLAVDPRQSPSETFIGTAADQTKSGAASDEHLGAVTSFELTNVHRYSPQILALIKHIHHEFPTLDLGQDWHVDFSMVESSQDDGPVPTLVTSATRPSEEIDIARAVHELYSRGRLAIAIVDPRQWPRFSQLASRLGASSKFHVSSIAGRTDVDGLGYRTRGLVVAPAEFLAGLQFETVLVAGIPDVNSASTTATQRTRMLSLLYLAASRAERTVRIFGNDDDGGMPEVLRRAADHDLAMLVRGSEA